VEVINLVFGYGYCYGVYWYVFFYRIGLYLVGVSVILFGWCGYLICVWGFFNVFLGSWCVL